MVGRTVLPKGHSLHLGSLASTKGVRAEERKPCRSRISVCPPNIEQAGINNSPPTQGEALSASEPKRETSDFVASGALRTSAMGPSTLFSKLQSFLPQMASANEKLTEIMLHNPDAKIKVEDISDDEKPYIAMEIAMTPEMVEASRREQCQRERSSLGSGEKELERHAPLIEAVEELGAGDNSTSCPPDRRKLETNA